MDTQIHFDKLTNRDNFSELKIQHSNVTKKLNLKNLENSFSIFCMTRT